MIELTEKGGSILFKVRVIPRSSKSEIVGEYGGNLKVKLSSPPVEGAANKELIKVLSRFLKKSKSEIEIISGETSKSKLIKVNNLNSQKFYAILQAKK